MNAVLTSRRHRRSGGRGQEADRIGRSRGRGTLWLAVFYVAAALVVGAEDARAERCQWRGSPPRCDTPCEPHEQEVWTQRGTGSQSCQTGARVFCCPRTSCEWRGTAPACDGRCKLGERKVAESRSGDGATCLTGKKSYCCKEG